MIFFFVAYFSLSQGLAQGWVEFVPDDMGICGVYFTDALHGTVVGSVGAQVSPGVIGITSDGGLSWYQNIIDSDYLKDVSYCDREHGITASSNGRVLRTTDSGITWQRQANLLCHTLSYNSINNIVALGSDSKIYRSTDGGG